MAITARTALHWSEQGYLPDSMIRHGIRRLLAERLAAVRHENCEAMADSQFSFIADMKHAPIALSPEKANDQHYEIPAAGQLLITDSAEDLSMAGFVPNVHYVPITQKNAIRVIHDCLDNPSKYSEIRDTGTKFVRENHGISKKMEFLKDCFDKLG